MKRFFKFFSVSVVALSGIIALNGCASIIGKGSPQIVTINSNPSEANLKIEDLRSGAVVHAGKTPYSATLTRGAGYFKSAKYQVVVEKDGYETKQFIIDGSPNGWYIGGNFIFGGLIGWLIVDPATGAMWTLSPELVTAELGAKTTMIKTGDGLAIALKNDVPKELQDKLEPLPVN
ncbi:MAG: hypothetical protein IT362_03940 [Deltaproteobacteria bacterium]|nr:hypothetical protein [Deltaproteobacteria bacterium]